LTNEVWGLCTFYTQDLIATVSDDATLRIWDVKNHRQKFMISLEIDINGNQIARLPDTSVAGGA
jgi:WD40 repeat protein